MQNQITVCTNEMGWKLTVHKSFYDFVCVCVVMLNTD